MHRSLLEHLRSFLVWELHQGLSSIPRGVALHLQSVRGTETSRRWALNSQLPPPFPRLRPGAWHMPKALTSFRKTLYYVYTYKIGYHFLFDIFCCFSLFLCLPSIYCLFVKRSLKAFFGDRGRNAKDLQKGAGQQADPPPRLTHLSYETDLQTSGASTCRGGLTSSSARFSYHAYIIYII